MQNEKLRTKMIWSLDGSTVQKSASYFEERGCDVLRLVHSRESGDIWENFVNQMQASQKSKNPSIMVDVSHYFRSQLVKLHIEPELVYGQNITLSSEPAKGDLHVDAYDWQQTFVKDSLVYIGYGVVVLKVLEVSSKKILATVVQGGLLRPGMHVFDAQTYKGPTVFDLTKVDISLFRNIEVDYVVIPGIATVRELSLVRKRLDSYLKTKPWLILRVDNKDVYNGLEQLLPHVDGVMIPRRELAFSIDPAVVPMACKEIIQFAHERAKIAILESDLLASMRLYPTPTRAEVSDMANAIIDGTDAIVLSEDLALGSYVEKALRKSLEIIADVESQESIYVNWRSRDFVSTTEFDAVSYQACKTAELVKAKAIVCITKTGNTALRLASFRGRFPIIAVTFSKETERKLSVVRGVESLRLDIDPSIDEILPVVKKRLISYPWLKAGDSIIFITVTLSSVGREASNLLTVQTLEKTV